MLVFGRDRTLLRFSVANFRSFRETATLEMVASAERQHAGRLPKVEKFRMKALPVAAVFGGNASGKSNFVSALWFAQAAVLGSFTNGLRAAPFRLDAESRDKPSVFAFELLIDEVVYHYSFEILADRVLSERLSVQNSTGERLIFSRDKGKLKFGISPAVKKEDLERMQTIQELVNDNSLFLSLAAQFKAISVVSPVVNWFEQRLCVIRPDSHLLTAPDYTADGSVLRVDFDRVLQALDLGIDHLDFAAVPRSEIHVSADVERTLKAALSRRQGVIRQGDIIWSLQDGELQARRILICRKGCAGEAVRFTLDEESAGLRRLLDLIPALLALTSQQSPVTFVIDEFDRSLHHKLCLYLLRQFLDHCAPESRSQLILTTHDLGLMDQKLLRRDELWLMDRDPAGASTMHSMSDFGEIRYDKDLRKMYLQGCLGGVPEINGRLEAV